MYNETLKREFIEKKKAERKLPSVNSLEILFEQSKDIEEQNGKDLYSFTVKEIISFYKDLNLSSLELLMNTNSYLKQYVDFCMENNIIDDLQNNYAEISDPEILGTCLNAQKQRQKFLTREQVIKICENSIVNNPMDKFIILALFEGIGKDSEELIEAKRSDFDATKLTFTNFKGEVYQISKQLYNYAEEAWEEELYYRESGKTTPFIPSEHCIKSFRIKRSNQRAQINMKIRARIKKILDNTFLDNVRLSDFILANTIYESGMIEYIRTYLNENHISFYDFVYNEDYKEILKNKHYKITATKKIFYTKYRGCFE